MKLDFLVSAHALGPRPTSACWLLLQPSPQSPFSPGSSACEQAEVILIPKIYIFPQVLSIVPSSPLLSWSEVMTTTWIPVCALYWPPCQSTVGRMIFLKHHLTRLPPWLKLLAELSITIGRQSSLKGPKSSSMTQRLPSSQHRSPHHPSDCPHFASQNSIVSNMVPLTQAFLLLFCVWNIFLYAWLTYLSSSFRTQDIFL